MCLHAQEKGLSSFSLVDLPRFVHLLHLSNFWKLLAFLGFALKQKCCIFFPTIMPLFLLPYIKKFWACMNISNIPCHQLYWSFLGSPLSECFQCFYTISVCSEQYRKQRQNYFKKFVCKSEAESDKSIITEFLKIELEKPRNPTG